MGRNKTFNEQEILKIIGNIFVEKGFNGTSLDDIVKGTGLLRGSLYSAFGSKLGMFIAALKESLKSYQLTKDMTLLLIAMLEVAPNNKEVKQLITDWYQENQQGNIAEEIGIALLKRSDIIGD